MNEEEDEWDPEDFDAPDTGEPLSVAIAALTMHADLEKSEGDRLDMFYTYFSVIPMFQSGHVRGN